MSDTPRTDAEDFYPHHSNKKVCDADFARQLERELNAAHERIQRLKEAGDALAYNHNPFTFIDWRKAKEAKL